MGWFRLKDSVDTSVDCCSGAPVSRTLDIESKSRDCYMACCIFRLATPSPKALIVRGKRRRVYDGPGSSSDDMSYSDDDGDSDDDIWYSKYSFMKTLAKQMIYVSQ